MLDKELVRQKIIGCWLGKAIGGTLGLPYEGVEGPLDLSFYCPVPEAMVANDDLDLQVLWACLLDRQAEPRVTPQLFVDGWKYHIDFPWDEYGVCRRNLESGIKPPLSGSHDNWFFNGMGAAIRSELWACLAPGDPALAAAYAREDACLDHATDGIWAEVFLAAMQSAAFVENDLEKIIATGFEHVPAETEIRRAFEDTMAWWAASGDWRRVRDQILARYGHENFTNVTENLAFMLLALLDGEGDFSRTICTATNCGKDTDCTAATVGALLGILNPRGIEGRWLEPIGRDLVLSPEIRGIDPPATLDGFTDMVLSLRDRMGGRRPVVAIAAELPDQLEIPARVGFGDVPWFDEGWNCGHRLHLELPEMESVRFGGTWAHWAIKDIPRSAIFVEYTIRLERATTALLLFNTNQNCRVFLNESYVFGREGGRMAPSPHRAPLNQSLKTQLSAGTHRLTAVIKKPHAKGFIDWVVGVADVDDNDQWLANPFEDCVLE